MFKGFRISLANKCQLLFGAAVVVILFAALFVVAQRMQTLVERGPRKRAQLLADAWLADRLDLDEPIAAADPADTQLKTDRRLSMHLIKPERFDALTAKDPFIQSAIEQFQRHPQRSEAFRPGEDQHEQTIYRYVRAIRASDIRALRAGQGPFTRSTPAPEVRAQDTAQDDTSADTSTDADALKGELDENTRALLPDGILDQPELLPPSTDKPQSEATTNKGEQKPGKRNTNAKANGQPPEDPLTMLLLVQLRDPSAATQTILNNLYLVAAGLLAGLLAIGVFWFITTRIILSPVRLLRDYAEQVYEGDLNIRSDINTGDEFEELSNMFNAMLENLKQKTDKLESINKSLDLKLGELAESNVALYEANKMKGQFLANVSHELRTPLNSVIGFAEVLQETIENDGSPINEKRQRYTQNIITSSRRLLDLITELLDLAKIEAGRMEVRASEVSIADTAEGLINLIRPQAEPKNIALVQKIQRDLPLVRTDPGKLQQILFNLLANAVKFTPTGGTVTLAAGLEPPPAGQHGATHLRLEVRDTGPGIAPEDQQRIFEQFTQLQAGLEREQGGTGLGLTISKELAHLLHGRLELQSTPDQGATFSIILPLDLNEQTTPLMPQQANRETASS